MPGWVINMPNKLYAGKGRQEPVDEIRHENDNNSPYTLE
jgi:dTDP-4-dehydrorhamnose 3,5-epimerase